MSSGSTSNSTPQLVRLLRELTGLDESHRAERLAFFEIGEDDERVLRGYQPLAQATVDRIVAEFYTHLLRFPELAELLHAEAGRIEKLQSLQREYFLSLADGRFDGDYFESRLRVGDAHQRIGLRPAWYIGAFALYLRLALRALVEQTGDGARILPTLEALIKATFLDISLAISTYIYGGFVDRDVASELERAARIAEDALDVRQEVERLKDDLTNMVVHDLKNPVSGIAMMVQLALRKDADLPEVHRGHLRQIDRTCREMMRLIQNLLEIGKMEEGKMPVVRELVVLAEVADEVATEYRPVAEQAGRKLRIAVATDLPPVIGDRVLLKRVLVNLVVNALRHSGSTEVVVGGRSLGAEVALDVTDYGHGIPEDERERIFEKFRSVRRSPSEDPAGDTGLGLPFCRLAVERMGGRIELASVGPPSTVFTVTLPAGE
ncbi:MAG TPA: protoglobin domain-containing protein [Candidatus Eisenbacteria bacterium]|nr:protoglobin domain-containing protein [Candidatus Eisenbacteria bacterium]